MRPGDNILIVGSDDEAVGLVRFILRNIHRKQSACIYKVHSVPRCSDAILDGHPVYPFDLVIFMEPLEGIQEAIHRFGHHPYSPKLFVITTDRSTVSRYYADSVMVRPSSYDLIQTVSLLLTRKRGPRKGTKRLPKVEDLTFIEEVLTA